MIVCAPCGVTPLDATDGELVPPVVVAVTVNVYEVPFVSPVTSHVTVDAPVVEHVLPPGLEVTV